MEEDSISFGRGPDPGSVSLQDVLHASYRRLVVQLSGITGSFDEAEEVVQEAFVRAAATGYRFLIADNHEAWLRTTAVHVHRSRWRKLRNGRRARDRMTAPRDREYLADHLEIIDALRSLPEPQRVVIARHYLADLPVEEIARELGVPSGTVRSRLGRGREALAAQLPTSREEWTMRERLEAFREEAELAVHLPDVEEIERRGWSRRRRHQAVIGAVAASLLAGTGVATQGAEPAPQPDEDGDRFSSTPYPANEMVTLHAGTYEIATSPDGRRPAARFTLPAGWNAGALPDRFEGLSDRVTYDSEINTRLVEADPDWSLRMLLSDVQWVAQRGCSDVEVTDAASLVQALTHVPGLGVTSSPVSAVRLDHAAVHLQLREQGSQSGPCWRRSILRSAAYGYLMHDEPGTVYDVWVVDVGDSPVLVGATWTRRTPGAEIDSLQGILDTIGLLEPS